MTYSPDAVARALAADPEWTLTPEQFALMDAHADLFDLWQNYGEAADVELVRELATTERYKALFGAMSFDESYDRYECVMDALKDED